jgi:hypothetical protein
MKKIIFGILIVLFVAGLGYCEEPSKSTPNLKTQSPSLKVSVVLNATVELGDADFNNSKYGPFGPSFNILAKVQNISKENIQLSDWSCSYGMDWGTDNKLITVGQMVCSANGLIKTVLKPGENKEYSLRTHLYPQAPLKDIHFKLGYYAQRPTGEFQRMPIDGGPFWSNGVTLHVKAVSEK